MWIACLVQPFDLVLIQREALKLSWYESFFEDYGIPNEVRMLLGRGKGK